MPYLDFVRQTMDALWEHQSMRISGNPFPSSPLCLTVTSLTNRGYLSMGASTGTRFYAFRFREKTSDERDTRLELTSWPLLARLTEVTGDPRHAAGLDEMAETFSLYGFDPRSGLAYWGQEAEFDVVLLGPGTNWGRWWPNYKPTEDLPREIMWRVAPDKMAHMSKAAFYGLITDPGNLDYNRFCPYGFDDRRRELGVVYGVPRTCVPRTGTELQEEGATALFDDVGVYRLPEP